MTVQPIPGIPPPEPSPSQWDDPPPDYDGALSVVLLACRDDQAALRAAAAQLDTEQRLRLSALVSRLRRALTCPGSGTVINITQPANGCGSCGHPGQWQCPRCPLRGGPGYA